MNTRFDGQLWIGAFGVTLEVKEMETSHLLNTVKMLLQKPARVQAMLVADIENATFAEPQAWTANRKEDIRKVSLSTTSPASPLRSWWSMSRAPRFSIPCWRSWRPVA